MLIVYYIPKTCIFPNTRLTICLFFASLHSAFFPGASLNSQGLGKAADLRFLHTVENVTAAIRNSYREKQGEEIRMRPRPLRPVFFSLSIIHEIF